MHLFYLDDKLLLAKVDIKNDTYKLFSLFSSILTFGPRDSSACGVNLDFEDTLVTVVSYYKFDMTFCYYFVLFAYTLIFEKSKWGGVTDIRLHFAGNMLHFPLTRKMLTA